MAGAKSPKRFTGWGIVITFLSMPLLLCGGIGVVLYLAIFFAVVIPLYALGG